MQVNARSDVTTQVKWRCLHYFRRECVEGRREKGKVPSIQNKMADVFFHLSYKSFTIICFHANFLSFSFVVRQNTYSCKSDLFANFIAVYIFPCALNSDIP